MKASRKLLKIAKEIEHHPEHWTQGVFARDEFGIEVAEHLEELDQGENPVKYLESEGAKRFCAFGFCYREGLNQLEQDYLMYALGEDSQHAVAEYNDEPGRTPDEIARLFRKAAKLAERDERTQA